jgi:hypothetical protein
LVGREMEKQLVVTHCGAPSISASYSGATSLNVATWASFLAKPVTLETPIIISSCAVQVVD